MAEWLKAPAWKVCIIAILSRVHLHELIHALSFVQLYAPGAIIKKDHEWGKNDHWDYGNDLMSERGGDSKNIDKKRKEYYRLILN